MLFRQLEELREPAEHDRPKVESFLKIANFDTDLQACLDDTKKALSYQTGKDFVNCGLKLKVLATGLSNGT